jgi:hypothetical protein
MNIWSAVWSFLGGLALLLVAALCIAIGIGAVRDIRTGKARSLRRMSTRVYDRAENPTDFWLTIAVSLFWGLLGIFLITAVIVGMLDA